MPVIHTASSATPLVAIDAVVLDAETTGLDTSKARIIQIGAVRITNGVLNRDDIFDVLIDPGETIPPETIAVHHITDHMVKGAPTFAEVWPDLKKFLGHSVIIGHSIGYDLAMLVRECGLAGIDWTVPRSLDTRVLAQAVKPRLPGFSMEVVGGWLGVTLSNRHNALGDALATADLFQAMLPHLREKNIRTIAEAENACRQLSGVIEDHRRAGWVAPVASQARVDAERTLARIDSYTYRHRVGDVMSAPPFRISADLSLHDAMKDMVDRRISSVFAVVGDPEAEGPLDHETTGILTERDVMRAVSASGPGALVRPVREFMSRPLATIPADAFLYRAVGRMTRLKVRHLGVADEFGDIIGAVSARDLLRLRASEAISLGDEIDTASEVPTLAAAWAKLPMVVNSLVAEAVGAGEIAAVISREIGAMVRKAAALVESRMAEDDRGEPPVPYAVMVLGSAGRGESLLGADQNTAIVFAEGDPDGPEDLWFAEFARRLSDILNEIGLVYGRSGAMASKPEWRGSLATWHDRIADWITRRDPRKLTSVDLFYDLRTVHGDAELGRTLINEAYRLGAETPGFAGTLVSIGEVYRPPIGMLGNFRTEMGRLDLKVGGLIAIVSGARALAIRRHIVHRATRDRLDGIRGLDLMPAADVAQIAEAHELLLGHIIRQQVEDLQAGHPLSNTVMVRSLSKAEIEALRNALTRLGNTANHLRDLAKAK